jgi:hypothetical protein
MHRGSRGCFGFFNVLEKEKLSQNGRESRPEGEGHDEQREKGKINGKINKILNK